MDTVAARRALQWGMVLLVQGAKRTEQVTEDRRGGLERWVEARSPLPSHQHRGCGFFKYRRSHRGFQAEVQNEPRVIFKI